MERKEGGKEKRGEGRGRVMPDQCEIASYAREYCLSTLLRTVYTTVNKKKQTNTILVNNAQQKKVLT